MATGLLVLGIGEGLKILRYLALDDKRYRATIRLGFETDTLDAEGATTASAALPELTREEVVAACTSFTGVIAQHPPAISALKQRGVALYKRVRRGERVETQARSVSVHTLEVEAVRAAEIDLSIHCGKGFYVRSLARDLARALGTLGHLSALRRVQSGCFHVAAAVSCQRGPSEPNADAVRLEWERGVLPIERALSGAPRLVLDAAGADHARHGRPIELAHVVSSTNVSADWVPAGEAEPLLLCGPDGRPLALARCSQAVLHVVRGLRSAL
jgi:tRNA pseudouridine55 synthase